MVLRGSQPVIHTENSHLLGSCYVPGSVLSLDTNTVQIRCSSVVTAVSLNPVAPTSQPFPSITNVNIFSKYYSSRQHFNYGHAQGEP